MVSAIKPRVADVQRESGLAIVGLIGSAARDELTPESDIDLAYRVVPNRRVTLIDVGKARRTLSSILKRDVDLIDWDAVKPHYRAAMREDFIALDG